MHLSRSLTALAPSPFAAQAQPKATSITARPIHIERVNLDLPSAVSSSVSPNVLAGIKHLDYGMHHHLSYQRPRNFMFRDEICQRWA